jgi:hypothetical protein
MNNAKKSVGFVRAKETTLCKPRQQSPAKLLTIFLLLIAAYTVSFSPVAASTAKEDWAKQNSESLMPQPTVTESALNFGGPDNYGYFYYDSQDSATNAPHYRWVEIANTPDSIKFYQDDQIFGPYPIGFSFNFYGTVYSTFRVCSNGWISFSSTVPEYQNRPIPSANEPNNLIAPFWDDLVIDSSMAFRRTNNNDSCIIEWRHFRHYPDNGEYTFQLILLRDGSIIFQYQQLSGVLDSHTIGIENSSGSAGLQYIYNTFRNETGTAVYFGVRPPHYASHDVMPSSFRAPTARGLVGAAIVPSIRFTNAGSSIESFPGRLKIFHDGELYNQTRQINTLRSDSSSQIGFLSFIPTTPGAYDLMATSELTTDLRAINDTIHASYYAHASMFSANFESSRYSFLGNHDWQWGTATRGPSGAHSGTKLWGTILDSSYTVGPLLSSLYSDTLFLSAGATLTFWQWYNIEAMFDGGNVKISTDDGASWSILTPVDGYDGTLSNAFENPMGGQPAFYGISPGWVMETIDLSVYAGTTAIIRFDFGSDNSGVSFGWFIDDFLVLDGGAAAPGWIAGTVTDYYANPIPLAMINAGNRNRTADSLGHYKLEIIPGTYSVTSSAPHYNTITASGVAVTAGDTTTINFVMPAPDIDVNAAAIDTSLRQERLISINRTLTNNGNGPLDFNIRLNSEGGTPKREFRKSNSNSGNISNDLPTLTDFGDEVFIFDPQTPTADDGCVGVEFDGVHFWVTGRHGIDEFHKLHKFDREGNYIASYNQNTRSVWGWRDLAFDGRYLYASDENEIAVIDTATGQKVDTLHAPSGIIKPLRGLAYDSHTDHFWAANFTSEIVEFDRTGQTIRSFTNGLHIFGLAWDDVSAGGPWLWVFSQDGNPPMQVMQFDPREGIYTGISFMAVDHNGGDPDLAGGACFTSDWDQSKGILFCMVMGRSSTYNIYDRVQGYEITPVRRWLRVEPMSGTIPPGENFDIAITLDFSDSSFVEDTLYQGAVTIQNNSAYNPTIPISVGLLSGIENGDTKLPGEFSLSQNYPNPFNSTTLIKFTMPRASQVKLEVFNILGQKVATLLNGRLETGYYTIPWNADGVSSGIYFLRATSDKFSDVKVMSLLK